MSIKTLDDVIVEFERAILRLDNYTSEAKTAYGVEILCSIALEILKELHKVEKEI